MHILNYHSTYDDHWAHVSHWNKMNSESPCSFQGLICPCSFAFKRAMIQKIKIAMGRVGRCESKVAKVPISMAEVQSC